MKDKKEKRKRWIQKDEKAQKEGKSREKGRARYRKIK